MRIGLLLIVFVLVHTAWGQGDVEVLDLERQVQSKVALNQVRTYQLTIPSDLTQLLHLFVVAEGETSDPLDTPDVVIQKGENTWRCVKKERADVCLVNSSNVNANDVFTVKVSCTYECTYFLRAYLSLQYKMDLGRALTMDFTSKSGFLIELTLPNDLNFSEVALTAILQNPEEVDGGLYMFVNAGPNVSLPTKESFQFNGRPIWNDGVGVFLRNGIEVRPGDTVVAFLYASDKTKVTINSYYENQGTRQIRLGDLVAGDCRAGSRKVYNLTIPTMQSDNYTIYIRIVKYSGSPVLQVSNQYSTDHKSNSSIKLLESATYQSFTQVAINANLRKEFNISSIVYLYVSSIFDSTYSISVYADNHGYDVLLIGMPEISVIESEEVDNYFFSYTVGLDKLDDDIQFILKTFEIAGKFNFGVRLCPIHEENDHMKCIVSSRNDVLTNAKDYTAIRGVYKRTLGITHFTFQQNSRGCYNYQEKFMYCLLHIVFYRGNSSADEPVKYQVELAQGGQQTVLQENTPNHFRQVQGSELFYSFALAKTTDVEEVRFYITVISGDCILVGSPTKRFPKLHDDPPNDIAKEDTLSYTSIAQIYYLSVKCFEVSLYSITASVKRANLTLEQPRYAIDLAEGLLNKYSMTSRQKTLQFYLQLEKPVPFDVSISQLKGKVWFEVYPAVYKNPQLKTKPWVAKNNRVHVDNSESNYESEYEFIVMVHSEGEAYFTIQYSTSTTCNINPVGRSISLNLLVNDSTCIGFSLNRHDDLDIVFSTPGFEMVLNQLLINRTIGGETKPLTSHTSKFSKAELQQLCPHILEDPSRNTSDCYLELQISTTNTPVSFSLVVEYSNDEIVLFDGLLHHTATVMSSSKPRHFYFELVDSSSALVFLYASGKSKYSITGRLVEWRDYAKSTEQKIYPSMETEGGDRFDSYTGVTGATVMIVPERAIRRQNCSNCVLLLSVYSSNRVEDNVTFDIEVAQKLTIMTPGDTRLGYVENGTSKKYIFASNEHSERLISLSTFTQGCAVMNLYSAGNQEGSIRERLNSSKNGLLIIPVNPEAKYYVAEVEGKDSCFYHITEVETRRRVYEFMEGVFYDLELARDEEVYLIYYNSRPESFRVVPQVNYGGVSFQALRFNKLDFHNVDELLDKTDKNYTFGGYSYDGSMKILKENSLYCSDCYYLISAKGYTKTSASLLVHYTDTPIPVRADKLVHDVVNGGENIQYVYYTNKQFNISVDTTYGHLNVTVKIHTKDILTVNVTQRSLLEIPHDSDVKNHNVYGNSTAYLITVAAYSFSSFTIQVISEKDISHMKYGVPSHLILKPNHEECLQFRAEQSGKSINLILSTDNTEELEFNLTCSYHNSAVPCNIALNTIDEEVTEENVHIELKAEPVVYSACIKSSLNMNVSAILSHNEVKILETTIPLLIKGNNSIKTYVSLYNPKQSGSVLIEAFECRAQVQLRASHDYLGLIRGENSKVQLNVSKNSGHVIATVDTPGEGLYFLSSTPIVPQTDQAHLTKFKYTWYDGQQPYLNLDSTNRSIKFIYSDSKLTWGVPAVISDNSRIVSLNYTLHVSNNRNVIKAASQCGLKGNYSKSLVLKPTDIPKDGEVIFEIDKNDISNVIHDSKQYYATVVCSITANKTAENNNDEYRIIYNTMEVTNIQQITETQATKTFWKTSIVYIVLSIVLVVVLVYCFKRQIKNIKQMFFGIDNTLAEETETGNGENAQELQGVELKEKSSMEMNSNTKAVSEQLGQHAIE